MLWRFVSILAILPQIRSDFTFFHLHNYLNHSISPCSNFHGHVCGAIMNPNWTVQSKSENFYKSWAAKLNSRSPNDVIMNDIIYAREVGECKFNISAYQSILQQRCGTLDSCYLDEFNYFYAMRNRITRKMEDTLVHFSKYQQWDQNLRRMVNVTSRLVETLINSDEYNFERFVFPYEHLHDRLSIIRASKWAIESDFFGLKKIREMFKILKETIDKSFKETPWLSETDVYGIDTLSQFLIILDEMHIGFDFDEVDADLSAPPPLNRFVTSHYFEFSKRSTGCARFDVLHPFETMSVEMDNNIKTVEGVQEYVRYIEGLHDNAFYNDKFNSVSVLAPMFYPLLWQNSSYITRCAFAAYVAHELFHPFVKTSMINSSLVFNQEYECIVNHFIKGCKVWAQDGCSSGKQTFEEDAPDFEALRVGFDLLKNAYNEEQLKEMEYEDLGITRGQAFFYAFALRYCRPDDPPAEAHSNDTSNDDSNDTVRLNANVAMLPEFTRAFGCQPEDEEYSEPTTVCYLFGPYAGFDREYQEDNSENNPEHETADSENVKDEAAVAAGADFNGIEEGNVEKEENGSGENPSDLK